MELMKTLDVTAEEFFDQIERSVMADIKNATGREMTRERLEGFKYEKRATGGGKAGTPMKVKIVAYRYPQVYRVKFTYARGTTSIGYDITQLDSGSIELAYTEQFTGNDSIRGFNRQIGFVIYERQVRARAKKTIRGIVSYIHRERKSAKANPVFRELHEGAEESRGD